MVQVPMTHVGWHFWLTLNGLEQDHFQTEKKKKEIFIKTNLCVLSCVGLFTALWIVAHQAPLSMGLSCVEAKERS